MTGNVTLDNQLISLSQQKAATPAAQAKLAATIAAFMQKNAGMLDGGAVATAISNLAYSGDQPGLLAIVNNLAPGQASTLGGTSLDQALEDLGGGLAQSPNQAPAASAATITDFMQKVGFEVSGNAISSALGNLSYQGDYAGVLAIVNNLAPGQAATLGGVNLGQTLVNLSGHEVFLNGVETVIPPASTAILTDFMQKVGFEVSGSAIVSALDNLSYVGNSAGVLAIVDNLAPGQASTLGVQYPGQSLDQALENLSGGAVYSPNSIPVASAATITDFMQKVGFEVSGTAVSSALGNLSYQGDNAGVLAIVDNLAPGQASTLAGPSLDEALENLSGHEIYLNNVETEIPPASSAILTNFMQKVGFEVSGSAIDSALSNLSYVGDSAGVLALVNNLAPGQVSTLAAQSIGASLDQTLENLTGGFTYNPDPTPIASAATIADFMQKVGAEITSNEITTSLSNLSYQNDSAGVLAIVDNLAPGQASTLGGASLDQTLENLSGHELFVNGAQTETAPASAFTIADFMQKVGFAVSGSAVGDAVSNLAYGKDQAGVTALVDNLATGQVTTIPTTYLDQALINLSLISTSNLSQQKTLAATLTDYMQKAGQYGDASAWGQAVTNLENAGDQLAANAILNNEPMSNRFSTSPLAMDTQLALLAQVMATAPSSVGAFSPQIAVPSTTSDHMVAIAAPAGLHG